MKIVIEDITGVPPYHLYKNARILSFEMECNCGKTARKTFILEDLEKQKIEELQKKLDRAIWWLNEIVENHRFTPITTAEKALKELNKKEEK